MRIRVIAVGTKMPSWVEQGVKEYQKRLPPELKLEIKELALGKRGKGADIQRAIQSEGRQMLAAIGKGDTIIALDVLGKPWGTEKLADELKDWQLQGNNVSLLIGGPDGLASECLAMAQKKWSLSALTMPHPLVRILLTEQLYRAWTINSNHPYHR
ncbi:MAG: 23S rRNA (pseudouridine1915-N3)-methyltransferase [Pseudohongiellaceae bacterium]|jgi:23S rRNA (pseudouridine1915-N3)-methyltransferase